MKEEYIHYMVPREMEIQWAKEAQEQLQIQLISNSNCISVGIQETLNDAKSNIEAVSQ